MSNRFPILKLAAVILLILLSCSKKPDQQNKAVAVTRQKYNVILVSIDTLRADFLKLYDPGGVDAPAMEGLAQDGILFRKVITQIPYTLPAHCSMLTGVYPVGHRVRDNIHDVLPQGIPTLAEAFQKQGYNTAGFIGSMVLARQTGVGRGFAYYDDYFSMSDTRGEDLGGVERRADDVLSSFQHWFEHRDPNRPFFTFVHFYDPHSPYDPPAEFRPASADPRDLYRGEIRYTDSVLGKFFLYLRGKNVWNNTVILVTSDHGEMLNEHQEIGHGYFLYRAALEVPMILRIPGSAAKEIPDVVELVDIAPTLLDLTGLASPPTLQGETLIPLVSGGHKKNRVGYAESYFAALQLGTSPVFAYQDERFKYIDSPKAELYDLQNDPGESKNLIEEKKDLGAQSKRAIANYLQQYNNPQVKKGEREVSSEEAEQFSAIGYLGGSVPESGWDRGRDPKDYIQLWNTELEAIFLTGQGRYSEALERLNKVEAAVAGGAPSGGPQKSRLPFSIALAKSKCYQGLGDPAKAQAVLEQAGEAPEVFNALAHLYAVAGKLEKANELYQKSIDLHFSYFALHNYILFLMETGNRQAALTLLKRVQLAKDANQSRPFLSEMFFLLQEWAETERLLLPLVQERPWEVKWVLQLADVYQAEGQSQKALSLMTGSYDRFSKNTDYLIRLGLAYHATGSPENEIETFKEALRVDPRDPRSYFYSAQALLNQKQDLNAVIGLTTQGLELGPDRDFQIMGHKILTQAYLISGRTADSQREAGIVRQLQQGYRTGS